MVSRGSKVVPGGFLMYAFQKGFRHNNFKVVWGGYKNFRCGSKMASFGFKVVRGGFKVSWFGFKTFLLFSRRFSSNGLRNGWVRFKMLRGGFKVVWGGFKVVSRGFKVVSRGFKMFFHFSRQVPPIWVSCGLF